MLGKASMYLRPVKGLGQNFLINEQVAKAEAAHSHGKRVLELGPGYGALTRELCKHAKRVVAVEKDHNLWLLLKGEVHSRKLKLLNKDFFDASDAELELGDIDIMISNIPYNLSSKVIGWLSDHSMQAVLCLQKEFVEHMLARPGSRSYSKLSVMTDISFSVTKIMSVSRNNFSPPPRVDSAIIYLKPKERKLSREEVEMLSLLMQHKKKKLINAALDSHAYLKMEKKEIGRKLEHMKGELEERVFTIPPHRLLELSRRIDKALQKE